MIKLIDRCNILRMVAVFTILLAPGFINSGRCEDAVGGTGAFSIGMKIGEKYVTWDSLEYEDSFDPSSEPHSAGAYKLVKENLDRLREYAPNLADYLETFFINGSINWSLVVPPLTPVETTGLSDVAVLYFKAEQAAVANIRLGSVMIKKSVWDSLTDRGKALVLMNGAMWYANRSLIAYKKIARGLQFVNRYKTPTLISSEKTALPDIYEREIAESWGLDSSDVSLLAS